MLTKKHSLCAKCFASNQMGVLSLEGLAWCLVWCLMWISEGRGGLYPIDSPVTNRPVSVPFYLLISSTLRAIVVLQRGVRVYMLNNLVRSSRNFGLGLVTISLGDVSGGRFRCYRLWGRSIKISTGGTLWMVNFTGTVSSRGYTRWWMEM